MIIIPQLDLTINQDTNSTHERNISFDEYLDWRETASKARDKYIKAELTAEEALKIIKLMIE